MGNNCSDSSSSDAKVYNTFSPRKNSRSSKSNLDEMARSAFSFAVRRIPSTSSSFMTTPQRRPEELDGYQQEEYATFNQEQEEPFLLGRKESFGVDDTFLIQSRASFSTKRSRSVLELGMG